MVTAENDFGPLYNDDQKQMFIGIMKDYNQYTLEKLKEILKRNKQTRTGVKDEMLAKIADGLFLAKFLSVQAVVQGFFDLNIKLESTGVLDTTIMFLAIIFI